MIKNLFTICYLLVSNHLIFSQTTSHSFEISEGFTIGQFNGQKNWSNWGYVDNSHSNIIDSSLATEGKNLVEVTPNIEQEENWGGIFYPAPNYKRISVSADVYLDSNNAADYDMLTIYSSDVEQYERLGGFYYNYDDTVEIGSDDFTVKNWLPNTWYNLKANINLNTKTIDYYINNEKLKTTTFNSNVNNLVEFDFEFDNYKSGFKIDNFKIQNLDNLSVNENLKHEIKIYPNPVIDYVHVKNLKNLISVQIFDISGKLVLTTQQTKINIKHLKPGNYIINIKTLEKDYSEKLIIN